MYWFDEFDMMAAQSCSAPSSPHGLAAMRRYVALGATLLLFLNFMAPLAHLAPWTGGQVTLAVGALVAGIVTLQPEAFRHLEMLAPALPFNAGTLDRVSIAEMLLALIVMALRLSPGEALLLRSTLELGWSFILRGAGVRAAVREA